MIAIKLCSTRLSPLQPDYYDYDYKEIDIDEIPEDRYRQAVQLRDNAYIATGSPAVVASMKSCVSPLKYLQVW